MFSKGGVYEFLTTSKFQNLRQSSKIIKAEERKVSGELKAAWSKIMLKWLMKEGAALAYLSSVDGDARSEISSVAATMKTLGTKTTIESERVRRRPG